MTQFASTLYPQTNPTNPVLLEFRGAIRFYLDAGEAARHWTTSWEEYVYEDSVLRSSSGAQKRHAACVLTRLASFSG